MRTLSSQLYLPADFCSTASIVYDDTTTNKNELLVPYLHYISRVATGEINHIAV